MSDKQSKILGTLNIKDSNTPKRKQVVYCFFGGCYPVYIAEDGGLFIELPTGKIDITKDCKISTIELCDHEKNLSVDNNSKSINIVNRKLEDFTVNISDIYYCNTINANSDTIIIKGLQTAENNELVANMSIFKRHNLTDEKIKEWENEIKKIKKQCKKFKKENNKNKQDYKLLIDNIDMDKYVLKFYNSYKSDIKLLKKPQFEQFNFFNITNTQNNVKHTDVYYLTNTNTQVKKLNNLANSCKKLMEKYPDINNNLNL